MIKKTRKKLQFKQKIMKRQPQYLCTTLVLNRQKKDCSSALEDAILIAHAILNIYFCKTFSHNKK